MTPTEAYRAALEAAATHVDGSARLLDELKAYNDALLCRVVAAAIRAIPVPEGLDAEPYAATGYCPECGQIAQITQTMDGETHCVVCGAKVNSPDGLATRLRDKDSSTLADTGDIDFAADELDRLRAENEWLRGMSPGVAAIAAERQRQITEEGWTAEHDDAHVRGELGAAAACYAVPSRHRLFAVAKFWPSTWGHEWWKPSGAHDDIEARRRDLVKAGALIAAEIDRLDRAALKGGE